MRRSISEIVDSLDERGDELAARPGGIEMPSQVHVVAVEVMIEMIAMGRTFSTGGNTPPLLSAMIVTLERAKPVLYESIANVPTPAIREFMIDLRDRLTRIIDAAEDGPVVVDVDADAITPMPSFAHLIPQPAPGPAPPVSESERDHDQAREQLDE